MWKKIFRQWKPRENVFDQMFSIFKQLIYYKYCVVFPRNFTTDLMR